MSDERDILEKKLRRLRFEDPRPALRTRTLNAVREELERHDASPGRAWFAGLADWRREALYAAAIVACLVVLPLSGPRLERHGPAPTATQDAALVRELGLTGDLAEHVNTRLALQREPRPKQRTHHDFFHRYRDFSIAP